MDKWKVQVLVAMELNTLSTENSEEDAREITRRVIHQTSNRAKILGMDIIDIQKEG